MMNTRKSKKRSMILSFTTTNMNIEQFIFLPQFTKKSLCCFTGNCCLRKALIWLVTWKWFDVFILVCILLNFILLIIYDSLAAHRRQYSLRNEIIDGAQLMFTAIFTIEFIFKCIALGFICHPRAYLRDPWNWLDFIVVVFGLFIFFPLIPNFKALRVFRVFKSLRSIKSIPSMRRLVSSLLKSLPNLFNVVIFLLFLFTLFGILGIQLFRLKQYQRCRETPQPLNGQWNIFQNASNRICTLDNGGLYHCPANSFCGTITDYNLPLSVDAVKEQEFINYGITGFDNLPMATLTIFQSITLEGWTGIMYNLQDAIHPAVPAVYFCMLVVIGSFFLLNLILAVIMRSFEQIDRQQKKKKILQDRKKREAVMGLVGKLEAIKPKVGKFDPQNNLQKQPPPNLLQALIGVIGEAKHSNEETYRTDQVSIQYYTDPVAPEELTLNFNDRTLISQGPKGSTKLHKRIFERIRLMSKVDINETVESQESIELSSDSDQEFSPRKQMERTQQQSKNEFLFKRKLMSHGIQINLAQPQEQKEIQAGFPSERMPPLEDSSRNEDANSDTQDKENDNGFGFKVQRYKSQKTLRVRVPQERCRSDNSERNQRKSCNALPCFESIVAPRITREQYSAKRLRRATSDPPLNLRKIKASSDGERSESQESQSERQYGKQRHQSNPAVFKTQENLKHYLNIELQPVEKNNDSEQEENVQEAKVRNLPIELLEEDQKQSIESERRQQLSGDPEFGSKNEIESISFNQEIPEDPRKAKLKRLDSKMPKWSKRSRCLKKLYRFVESPLFNLFVFLAILANTIFLALDRYPIPQEEITIIERANLVFYYIFLLEMILKVIAMGLKGYLSRPFNIFDGIIVLLSTIQVAVTLSLDSNNYEGGAFTVFRSFRLLRIFKIARSWTSFQELLTKIGKTLKDLWSFLILLLIVIFCFALVGRELFAYGAYFGFSTNQVAQENDQSSFPAKINFNGTVNSVICIFVVLSGEDWQYIFYDYYRNFGITATVYFVTLIIIGNFIFLNLFLALLLRDFEDPTLFMKKVNYQSKTRKGRKAYLQKDIFLLHRARKSSLKGRWQSFKKGIRNIFVKRKRRKIRTSQTDPTQIHKLYQLERQRNHPTRVKSLNIGAGRNSICETDSVYQKSQQSGDSPERKDDISSKSNSPQRNLLGFSRGPNSKQSSEIGELSSVGSDERDSVELQRQQTILVKERPMEGKSLCIFKSTSKFRKCIHAFISHKFFYYLILILILVSSIMLALEDPLDNPYSNKASILFYMDIGITAAFCLEAVLKIVSYGLLCNGKNSYLRNIWDIVDFIIAVFSIVSIIIDSSQTKSFKAFRLLRVLRPLRFISKNEGLKLAVKALVMSIPDIFNVLIIYLLFFLVFGIFSVNYFKGAFYYCEIDWTESQYLKNLDIWTKQDCYNEGGAWKNRDSNFDNALNAFLLLFEISTSEGWVEAMYWGVQSRGIDHAPQLEHQPYWAFFFIFLFMVGGLFHVNLFVGVLIQKFEEMKEILGKNFLLTQAQRQWIVVRLVSYKFKPIRRIQTYIHSKCRRRLYLCLEPRAFEWFIMICIIINTSIMAVTWYGEPEQLVNILQICNYFFAAVFTLQALLKIIALGKYYFKDGWNIFDFVIVIGTLISIILSQTTSLDLGTQTTLVRTFRIGRIFRLIRQAKSLRTIFQTFLITLPSMANVGGILLIVIYIYAILGVNLFATVKLQQDLDEHANFQNFGFAFMTLMRVSTGEAWNAIMHDTVRRNVESCVHSPTYAQIQANGGEPNGCGSSLGYIFFISFVIIITFIYLNLFIAIILQGFEDTAESANLKLNGDTYEQFREKWSKYDKKGRGLIRICDFEKFLKDLDPPLGLPKNLKRNNRIIKTLVGNLKIPSYQDLKYFGFHDVLQAIIRETLIRQRVKEALVARKERAALFPEDEKATDFDHRVVEIELENAMKQITTDLNVWKESKIYQRMRKEQKKYLRQKQKFKVDNHDSRYIWALWIISRQLKGKVIRRRLQESVKKALTLKQRDTVFDKLK